MAYNLVGIRERVLNDKLDDEDFDPSMVDRFINDAQRDIFNQFELPFQEKIFQGIVPSGSIMFELPTDLAVVQSQTMSGVRNFSNMKTGFRALFASYPDVAANSPAAPGYWAQYAGNILLSAPTDKDYTLTIYYIKKPVTLQSDTDVPDVPYEFEELLILGAYIRLLKRNEDFDLAREEEKEYTRIMTQLVNRYGFRASDGPIKMNNRQIG